MANWNNPTLTSTYTNFVTEVKDRDVEVALWFEGMSPTNLPTNAKRLNTSNGRFEKWNGSSWVDAVATFTFPALSVAGAATVTGALTINGGIANNPTFTAGTANGVPYLNGSKVLTSGAALVFDGTNLGIGTSSPSSKLEVRNDVSATTSLDTTAIKLYNNLDGGSGIEFSNAVAGKSKISFGVQSSGGGTDDTYIGFSTCLNAGALTERMRLDSSGNLGIGTSSPVAKLTVNGNQSFSNTTYQIGYALNTETGTVAGANSPFYGLNMATFTGFSGNGIGLHGYYGLLFSTAGTERMRLDSSGNLGLGVTPSAWSVIKAIEIGGFRNSVFSDNGSASVGIASGSYYNAGWKYALTGSTVGYYEVAGNAHRWYTAPSGTAGNAITFTQAMTLNASGNLGVGTISPSQRLTVAGSAQLDSSGTFYLNNSDNTNQYYWQNIGATGANNATLILSRTNAGETLRITSGGDLEANASVTGYWKLPNGTTAQRPTGSAGMIRFNTSLTRYEGHNGSAWSSIGGGATGGGSDDIFYENGQTVTTNYTITTNKNAMSAGPVTIASGITVTVPSGSNWAVV